jgi:sulfotransferase family protein
MSAAPPVFVGGTGRSGTTIVGRLLGRSSRYEVVPAEAKFHVWPGGLPGYLTGKASNEDVVKLIRTQWNDSRKGTGGLASFVKQAQLKRGLEQFVAADGTDRVDAARELVNALLDPVAQGAGKSGWVEMTPRVVFHGRMLHRLFPEMKLVHTVRDGRDVASSLVARGWQPDLDRALSWWEARLRRAHQGIRKLPEGTAMVVNLEDLVLHRREETYARVLDFVGLEDERGLHQWFVRTMRPELAHIGRWRDGLSNDDAARINKAYSQALRRLSQDGVQLPSQVPI